MIEMEARVLPPPDGDHLWAAVFAFRVTHAELVTEAPVVVLPERILSGPNIGCLHCAQLYSPELLMTACPAVEW